MNEVYRSLTKWGYYRVINIARCAKYPERKVVVFKQLYDNIIKYDGNIIHMPKGTLLVTDFDSFNKNYKKV